MVKTPRSPSGPGEPVPEPLRAGATVLEVLDEGGANRRIRVRVEGWPGFAAGQFVMIGAGPVMAAPRTDPLLPRPMAIYREIDGSGSPDLEILFKVGGRGTALLSEARAGDVVSLVGPLGTPFPGAIPGEQAILVGGGTGVASIYQLARERTRVRDGSVSVLFGARSAGDLMGVDDFEALDAVAVSIATEDGSRGSSGLVTDLLAAALADGIASSRARVYACGPVGMMRRAAEVAKTHGIGCVVSLENHMACGFGVCLGCAAPLSAGGFGLVCREGPVFDAEAVAWEGLP